MNQEETQSRRQIKPQIYLSVLVEKRKEMNSCELCMLAATTYCESDQASLCWDCDAKVHGANFLVVRHVRCLLCHVCQSCTPWRATGFKLGHTTSVCEMCAINGGGREDSRSEKEDKDEEESDSSDDVEEEADNQVVSWCSISNTPPQAPSSSSTKDSSSGEPESKILFSLKRLRANASEIDSLSAKRRYGEYLNRKTNGPNQRIRCSFINPIRKAH